MSLPTDARRCTGRPGHDRAAGRRPPPGRGEEGVALVMVLIFLIIAGAVILALLRVGFASLSAAAELRGSDERVYAADGGLQSGIQQARIDPTRCAAPGAISDLDPVTINGRTVQIRCVGMAGASPGAGGWAVYIPDGGQIATKSGGGADNKVVSGPVYLGTDPAAGGWDLEADLHVRQGPVVQRSSGACTPPAGLQLDTPLWGYRCVTEAEAVPTAPQRLPASLPLLQHHAGTDLPGCRVFEPGTYTQAPELDGANYFRSGVYFLDNVGTWSIGPNTEVVAGRPAPGESAGTSASACYADTPGVTGVTFLLGGNSTIEVHQGSLEVFSVPAADAPGVSIRQLRASDPGPWAAKASTVTGELVTSRNGAKTELVVHGLVYGPDAGVQLSAANGGTVQLRGGVVTRRLEIWTPASNGPGGVSLPEIGGGVAPGTGRTVEITASAQPSDADEKTVSATAVVRIANDPGRAVSVLEWQVVNP